MARISDGWVLIPKVSGPKVKDGKCYVDVSVESRELVMCKNCKHLGEEDYCCTLIGAIAKPDWFCADGERRDSE